MPVKYLFSTKSSIVSKLSKRKSNFLRYTTRKKWNDTQISKDELNVIP